MKKKTIKKHHILTRGIFLRSDRFLIIQNDKKINKNVTYKMQVGPVKINKDQKHL